MTNISLVNALVSGLNTDTNLLVQVMDLTPQAKVSLQLMMAMLDSLPQGEFLDFIYSTVSYKVDVTASLVNGEVVSDSATTLSSFNAHDYNYFQSGVYKLGYDSDTYFGSATDIFGRIAHHVRSLQGLTTADAVHLKILATLNEEWPNMNWSSVYHTANYTDLALKMLPNYPFSVGEMDILRTFTRFVPRVLEQSLISAFDPSFNDLSQLIEFDTKIWDPSLLDKPYMKTSGYPVTIMNEQLAVIQEFSTIGATSNILNQGYGNVSSWIANAAPVLIPTIGVKVFLAILLSQARHGNKVLPKTPIASAPLSLPSGLLTDLAPGAYWLFGQDKVSFLGPFVSFTEVIHLLYPYYSNKGGGFLRYRYGPFILALNREILVDTPKGKFYVACNPNKPPLALNPVRVNLPTRPFVS